MKARIQLAEAATGHPDGTVSVLRGGITEVKGQGTPIPFMCCIVVRIETEVGDGHEHNFDLTCLDDDGQQIIPSLKGQFTAPPKGSVTNLLLNLSLAFAKHGRFGFYLRIDGHQHDAWHLTVSKLKKGKT